MSRGRDMMKWQNALMSHLDETDSDSDKESALSGSFMVDSVMNDLRKRGYRNSSMYKGDEFSLDPVAEVTVEDMSSVQREHRENEWKSRNAPNRGYGGIVNRAYYGNRPPHQSVSNGNSYNRSQLSSEKGKGSGNEKFYDFDHLQGSYPSHQHQGASPHASQKLGRVSQTHHSSHHIGYHGNHHPPDTFSRPDSREGRSYNIPSEQPLTNAHSLVSSSHGRIYAPPRHDDPRLAEDRRIGISSSKHHQDVERTRESELSPLSPTDQHIREGHSSSRQRSQSLGRTAEPDNDSQTGNVHSRSGSLTRSDGGTKKELDLHEVVELLYSKDSSLVAYSASYLQHLAYGDDTMKMRIRDQGAIPILIGLLRHSERKVQLAVLGALRNLSFGRMNDTNKLTIAQDHGLHELVYQLRSSRSAEVRELVTGVLWNLSSCEHLKVPIIKASLLDIINYVLIRNSGWSPELALNLDIQPNNINWTQELCNTTGMLRNVSSAGEEARLSLRSAKGLIDTLLWMVRGCLGREEANSKTVENVMCILRNLSYRVEAEIDPQEGTEDILDKEWELEQNREMEEERKLAEKHELKAKKSSFSLCVRPATKESFVAAVTAREEASGRQRQKSFQLVKPKRSKPVYGTALLWQPDTTGHYVTLLQDTTNPEAQEAACGALHNLTACTWKWASYQRKTVRLCDGLPVIVSLVVSENDAVTRASATALRNLAIDPLNKAVIGEMAMHKLVSRLPYGSRHHNMTDQTTISIVCALIELVAESPENIRFFRQAGGVVLASRLARSSQHHARIVFAANKLCALICEDRDGKQILKKENWDISHYNKMFKESGGHYDFEPRSTAKEFKGSRRGSKRSKKEQQPHHKKASSSSKDKSSKKKQKSSTPSSGKRSRKDELPPSPTQMGPPPDANPMFYDSVEQKKPQTSAPTSPLQYAAISREEQASVVHSSHNTHKPEPEPEHRSEPLVAPEEAVNIYSAVNMDKKRAERKYSGQSRDSRRQAPQQQQHQQQQQQQQQQHFHRQPQLPSHKPPPAADSWV